MKKVYLILVILLFNSAVKAQSTIAEQSAYLDSVITSLSETKAPALLFSVLNEQLNLKNSLISQLKFQIVQLDKDIYNNELFHKRLNSQLEYEKDIYASLVVTASRLQSMMHQNFDIFSFDNLYKTYRQFLYIKWLTDYRQKKIKRIKALKAEIATVVGTLDSIKNHKNSLAEKIGVEQSFINRYSQSRNLIAKNVEAQMKTEDVSREIIKTNLNTLAVPSVISDRDETVLFQLQKGYLIWPVEKAVIIRYFGESKHPVYDKITIRNDGLDFCAPKDSKVRCVYNGIVAKVVCLPENKFSVIVRHGDYYTVYSDLNHITVSQGDELQKMDVVGDFDTEDNHAVFNFQIWQGSKVLNPYDWLIKKEKK
jgi:murein DD-endopeptidase MepM/ murein hydrolase activator NlpD